MVKAGRLKTRFFEDWGDSSSFESGGDGSMGQ